MYVVLILCVVWCVFALYSVRKRNASAHKLPPVYPGGLPIIGHTHILLVWIKDIFGFLESMADFCLKCGGVTCGYFGGDLYYGVVDPEDAATVANTLLQKHPFYRFGEPWLGQGLVLSSGAYYKRQRRLLLPAFSLPVIHGFLDVFNEQSKRLIDMWNQHAGEGPFDPVNDIRDITLRTSCITVFGDNDEKDKMFINTYTRVIDEILEVLTKRIEMFWLHNDFVFKFSSLKKKLDRAIEIQDKISYEVIHRKQEDLRNKQNIGNLLDSEKGPKPFLEVILDIAADGSLTDKEIRDELNTVVAASFETSSQQLCFIIIFVGSYPEVQDKIYQEIMEVVGDRDVEKQDLPKLVYTEAVIKESLRMIPAIGLIPRYVDKDLKLKNYTLRAGSQVLLMPCGIHRHPAWGPDADVFKPDRWLDKEMNSKLASLYFPFSFGPRSCIGRKYAYVSLKVSLVHIIRQFRVKADHTKLKMKIDMATRIESGQEIELERRNSKYDLNQNIKLLKLNANNTNSHER